MHWSPMRSPLSPERPLRTAGRHVPPAPRTILEVR